MANSRIAILVDGGFLRVQFKKAARLYVPETIESFALRCKSADEDLFRILYYNCAPFTGKMKLPVSGEEVVSERSSQWLHDLARKDLFAVRLGVLKYRGFRPRKTPLMNRPPTDADFEPYFEQKGVDMRIGLDIAAYSANKAVDRIVLISNDTDCVPALKYARRAGIQIVLIEPPGIKSAAELVAHCDYKRFIAWPS